MPNQVNSQANSQPSKININAPLVCYGMSVRTNNNAEMSSDTAKIGTLWEGFYQKIIPKVANTPQIYGIYYNYESDVNGDFDVMAGVSDVLDEMSDVSLISITIPDGNYLVFKQQGQMPQAVITAWQQVWAYFNNANCQHTRKYSVDFEKYIAENEVEVYIAIQ